MFAETFAKIRDNFRAMFTEVFGGGKRTSSYRRSDVLESGIESWRVRLEAAPEHHVLSGGEQT